MFNRYNAHRKIFESAKQKSMPEEKIDGYKVVLEKVFGQGLGSSLNYHDLLREEQGKGGFNFATFVLWVRMLVEETRFHFSAGQETMDFLHNLSHTFKLAKLKSYGRTSLKNAKEFGDIFGQTFCCKSILDFHTAQADQTRKTGHAATYRGEDLLLYYLFFAPHDRADGSFKFLDIGADNGLSGSNTYLFETQRNWQGFLVEPAASLCLDLRNHRNLTKAHVACPKAVCRNPGQVQYHGNGQAGGAVETMPEAIVAQRFSGALAKSVACDTTAGILRELNAGEDPEVIHIWSLDCGGCEDVALETFNWLKTRVAVLMVKLSPGLSCGGRPQWCEEFLVGRGMMLWAKTSDDNQIWYSAKYFEDPTRPLPQFDKRWLDILERQSKFYWQVGNVMFDNYRAMIGRFNTSRLPVTPLEDCLRCGLTGFDYNNCTPFCT